MKRLNPEKLHVEFRQGAAPVAPIMGRKYTLTHSDMTAELFLAIGSEFAYDEIGSMRDEVLAEWRACNGCAFLYVYIYVDGQFGPEAAAVRNAIFRRELPLALEAIRYGDGKLFAFHPQLDNVPIWIRFDSAMPQYDRFEYWGTPKDYA